MRIVVTDLTRFTNKQIVCLAGIDPDTGTCVRPMVPSQGKLEYLSFDTVKQHNVIPGSCLEGNFVLEPGSHPPHVEDHRTLGGINLVAPTTGAAFQAVLEQTSVTRLSDGFGANPVNRLFGLASAPARSIITLKLALPAAQFRLVADGGYGKVKFKAHVRDASGYELSWLPVTDLGFSDHIERVLATDPTLTQLNAFLQSQDVLYLRIGLSRSYAPPDRPDREGYWVQLNGIYSFPSYREDLRIYD